MTDVLARRDRALNPDEIERLLRDRLGDDAVLRTVQEFGVFSVWIAPSAWVEAATRCRDEALLAYDMFDHLFAVDAREEGFDVVAILYSTTTGNRIALRTRCEGAREAPVCPSLTGVYRGANWMERETWDMFGIVFEDHPGLEPRILTVENFDGWPLRKDFPLATRAVKPWPGVKEPAELDEDGNVIERVPRIGDAPGPYELDKALAEQAKLANPAPEPETIEGVEAEVGAASADLAADSGAVVAGSTEQGLETRQKARAEGDAADPVGSDEPQIDQEVFDRLIAEGKSERVARSKAKAAFIKAQRAAAAGGADSATAAEAAGAEAAVTEVAAGGSGSDAAQSEAGDEADERRTEQAEARDKAEQRRRGQAEARARKAAERAAAAELEGGEGSPAEPSASDGSGTDGEQEGDA